MSLFKWSVFMPDYNYRENIHKKLARSQRAKIFLVSVFSMLFLLVGLVIYDALKPQTIISNTKPQLGILGTEKTQVVFDTIAYRLSLESGWTEASSQSGIYDSYKPYRYVYRDADGLVRRELYVFVDTLPKSVPVNYVVPVDIAMSKIVPLNDISPRCNSLLEFKTNDNVPVEWWGIDFICKTDNSDYLVSAVHSKTGQALQIPGTNAVHRYMFLYHDVSSSPRYDLFLSILRNFDVK